MGRTEQIYDVPGGVSTIGDYAFYSCKTLVNINLPQSVVIIGDYAFYNTSELCDFQFPSKAIAIGNSAFCYCNGLSNVVIPNGIKTINESVFAHSSIESIVIPDSVTVIKSYAFGGCRKLTSIDMSKKVERIEYRAFAGCGGIQYMVLPETTTYIDEDAMSYDSYMDECENYTEFYVYKGSYSDTFLQSIKAFKIKYIDENTVLPIHQEYLENDIWDGTVADENATLL